MRALAGRSPSTATVLQPAPPAPLAPGRRRWSASATGAANIIGTVTVIDGTTLYVTDSSGNVVKVTTNTGTTVSKTDTGTVSELAPGESVVIRGVQSSAGVYAAQTVSEGAAATFGGGGGFAGRGGAGRGAATAAPSASPSASAGSN